MVTAGLVFVTALNLLESKRLVKEISKDRRRQFLEGTLEKIVSPIYEILRRGDKNFYLSPEGLDQMRRMFQHYGHYLNAQLYEKLRKVIIDQRQKQNWDYAEMDGLYKDFTKEFGWLRKEIQDLARIT